MTKRLGPDANPGAGAVPAPDAAHAVRRSSPTLLARLNAARVWRRDVRLRVGLVRASTFDHLLALLLLRLVPRESIELRFLGTIVRAGMTVADVGAAQGIVTLALAHLVGSTGRVLALEAEPVLLEALEFNAARNAPGTIEVHPLALGGGHIPGTASGPDPARAPVTLDEVMGDQPLHLVRIDARGAEGAVLDGMTRILGRRAPLHIVTAFSPVRLRRAGTDPAGFLDRLWACGFTLGRVDARGCVSIDTAEQLLDGRAGDASVVLHARRVSRIVS